MKPCKTQGPGRHCRDGYVQVHRDHRRMQRHKAAWVDAHGPVPQGMYVCHTCDNPPCWELTHLFLGTPADNAIDREMKGRGNVPVSRFTREEAAAMADLYREGWLQREIGAQFGISQTYVSAILSGKVGSLQ